MGFLRGLFNNAIKTYTGKQSLATGLKYVGNAFGQPISQAVQSGGQWFNNTFDPTGKVAQQNEYEKNLALQQQAQAYNSAEAEKARAFEAEMSNTAYSRAFKDLESAGVNPYLALTAGSMASTPSGSGATSSAASVSRQNNQVLGSTIKVVDAIMKLGQNSSSSLAQTAKSVGTILALAGAL